MRRALWWLAAHRTSGSRTERFGRALATTLWFDTLMQPGCFSASRGQVCASRANAAWYSACRAILCAYRTCSTRYPSSIVRCLPMASPLRSMCPIEKSGAVPERGHGGIHFASRVPRSDLPRASQSTTMKARRLSDVFKTLGGFAAPARFPERRWQIKTARQSLPSAILTPPQPPSRCEAEHRSCFCAR